MTEPEFETITLHDPSSALTATFVPRAGMIGTSLSDGGVELLGQRRGLSAYLTAHKTMGIPLLYPWANRLGGTDYPVDGGVVTLTPGNGGVGADAHGAPIHGVLAGHPGWRVCERQPTRLVADFDFGSHPGLLASFPFPHLLQLEALLADRTLTLRTTVTATGRAAVPVCFGFHPYLTLPGVPRAQWHVETPAMRSRAVDAHGIPTGATESAPAASAALGAKALDDGYDEVVPGAVFAVSGAGRRIEVHFDRGYPAAQIYAPLDDDVICFEPMAAPTDALRRGGYPVARPGEPAITQFSIRVS